MNNSQYDWVKRISLYIMMGIGCIGQAFALKLVPSDSNYYYAIQGGSDFSMPPVTNQEDLTIGADVSHDLGFSCGGFNPGISINNTFANMENSVENVDQNVLNSATAAIGSFPMYALQKASPEAYNLIQNTLTSAEDSFHIGVQSCQSALNQISQGKSPYQDWFSISDSQGWLNYAKQASAGQDVDVTQVQTKLAQKPAQYGVPWVHGANVNSGGSEGDQVPIRMIYDVVVAGYNTLVDPSRALDDQDAAPTNSPLTLYWKTPAAAGKFGQLILGDIYISSVPAKQQTQSSRNLESILTDCPVNAQNNLTCITTLQQKLASIVQSKGTPTATELITVSSNETLITPQVIEAIRNQSPQAQALSVSKLANDVAVQNLFDELQALQRLLQAGARTKPVFTYQQALDATHHAIQTLNTLMDNLVKTYQLRGEMMTQTAKTILGIETQQQTEALGTTDRTQLNPLDQGATYEQSGE